MQKTLLKVALFSVFGTTMLCPQTAAPKPPAPKAPAASQPTKQTVESFLKQMFGYDSNLKTEVLDIGPAQDPTMSEVIVRFTTPDGPQVSHLFISPNQKFIISGEIVPFGADPFAANRQILQQKAKGPSRGAANPEVTLVEFADLQCPSCQHAQPVLEQLMQQLPNAKLIFQQFPLVQIHKWAFDAAKYAECVAQQNNDAFWKFSSAVYEHQDAMQSMSIEDVEPRLKDYATQAGANAAQITSCVSDPKTAAKIYASMELGKELDVTGTPTLFIGGRKIGNVGATPQDVLKDMADFQAAQK